MYKNRDIYCYLGEILIQFELNFVAKYKNRGTLITLSGKIDGHWHAHNRISHRSDAPLKLHANSLKMIGSHLRLLTSALLANEGFLTQNLTHYTRHITNMGCKYTTCWRKPMAKLTRHALDSANRSRSP